MDEETEIKIETLYREIGILKEKAKMADARIQSLEVALPKSIKTAHGYDKELQRYCDSLQEDSIDAFDRISNIEKKLFPYLQSDMVQLNQIINDPGPQPENPLDKRKP